MSSLYEKILNLCNEQNISVAKMCGDIKISRGNITELKKGRIKSLSATTLQKIANYFSVSVDLLIGNEDLTDGTDKPSPIYERIRGLCDERGLSGAALCKEVGLSRSAMTELKSGRTKTLSASATAKVADFFGVSVGYLLGNEEASPKEKTPALTKKDERDIAKKLQETLEELEGAQGALMFDGEPLDEETRELLAMSLKNSMEMGKKIAKAKYTPKKYR